MRGKALKEALWTRRSRETSNMKAGGETLREKGVLKIKGGCAAGSDPDSDPEDTSCFFKACSLKKACQTCTGSKHLLL